LKDLMLGELVDQTEALIERQLIFFCPSRSRKTMDAGKVTLVRNLPGHIDRGG
jgi:hypothetical protein